MGSSEGDLNGRRCLVTGGAGGIGAATARRFAAAGAKVAVCDLDAAGVGRVVAELQKGGFEAHPFQLDVTDDEQVAAVVGAASSALGGIDTLVANAGIFTYGPIEEVSAEDFRRTLEVNLVGTFLCIRRVVPELRKAGGGAIVCVASQSGIEGVPEASAYCASKFGVVGIVESLARELTGEGIRVTAVAPSPVETPMIAKFYETQAERRGVSTAEIERKTLEEYPIGRLASAAEIADAIAFLASDKASYISGAVLPLIGGQVSR
ncbi:MAG TPA: SDR family oxidoreductase [Solirubrobacterales bacterium]|nr:SDR family oxidoreductase [Solirubrobacterales bacterium]